MSSVLGQHRRNSVYVCIVSRHLDPCPNCRQNDQGENPFARYAARPFVNNSAVCEVEDVPYLVKQSRSPMTSRLEQRLGKMCAPAVSMS